MAGHAGPARREPGGARYRAHDSDRQIEAFQHRSLLDVEFDIGQQFAAGPRGRADMVGIETELGERIAHRDAGGVLCAKQALVERSRDRAAAQQRGGEADPLLVGEPGHLDGERQSPPPFLQIGDAANRGDQSKWAVPFAGVAHGVVVRAQHQARQTRNLAFITATDISDRVEMRAHSRRSHPAQEKVGSRAMLFGKKDAGKVL
jgi:cation diffusion facilitator CzcD-associated flavoprotein CzcO